jgi:hypothetical protein
VPVDAPLDAVVDAIDDSGSGSTFDGVGGLVDSDSLTTRRRGSLLTAFRDAMAAAKSAVEDVDIRCF